MRRTEVAGIILVGGKGLTRARVPSGYEKEEHVGRREQGPRAVFKEDGPLVETRRVLSLLYSLSAEGSLLGKVHPFRERL
jgi:hypothetical protein